MKSKAALLLSCFLIVQLFFFEAFAQTEAVSGKVTDKSSGEPLSGATITVKGSQTGTKTDANGNFTINAKPGSVLTISFVGMAEREVLANSLGFEFKSIEFSKVQ